MECLPAAWGPCCDALKTRVPAWCCESWPRASAAIPPSSLRSQVLILRLSCTGHWAYHSGKNTCAIKGGATRALRECLFSMMRAFVYVCVHLFLGWVLAGCLLFPQILPLLPSVTEISYVPWRCK